MLRNTQARYGLISRGLHWLLALALSIQFSLGWYMTELSYYDRWYKDAFEMHKACGMLLWLLALLRILWALYDRPPPLVKGMRAWERLAARASHSTLYLLTLLIPLSGYLISTAKGHAIDMFGLFEIPALLPAMEQMEETAGKAHYLLAFGAAWLVVAHALAALKHHLIERDDTLKRMIYSK
jgi:cytochrome b561